MEGLSVENVGIPRDPLYGDVYVLDDSTVVVRVLSLPPPNPPFGSSTGHRRVRDRRFVEGVNVCVR
jgi:hypothetical protein